MYLSPQKTHRFQVLDALRGIAALLVIQVHLPFLFAAHKPFPHSYLAVDFFFMLSGFVLAHAYGTRLAEGWPTLRFLRERVVRLYPLYLLALPLGFAHLLVTSRRDHVHLTYGGMVVLFAFALFMVPLPKAMSVGGYAAFPLNGPSWSLFYELTANVVHATLLRSRTTLQLTCVAAASALCLIPVAVFHEGLDIGSLKGETVISFVRIAYAYSLGIVLFRLWSRGKLHQLSSGFFSALLLISVLVCPVFSRWNHVADLVAVFLVFPFVLILGANAAASAKLAMACNVLGTTSYALYVLHVPLYAVYATVWEKICHTKTADHAPVSGLVYLVFLLMICYAIDYFYDSPVRRLARRYFKTRDR